MIAMLIKKGVADWIQIDEDIDITGIEKILGTKMASSSVRYIGMFRFRVYHKDYIPNPKFYTSITPEGYGDIPEESLIILTDYDSTTGIEEFISINPIVHKSLIDNIVFYDYDDTHQPIIRWKPTNSL